mgnify:CR=1 FL=1
MIKRRQTDYQGTSYLAGVKHMVLGFPGIPNRVFLQAQ